MAQSVAQLLEAGDLDGAIDLQNAAVRQRPTETALRVQLAELLCFAGNLERADRLLDAALHQDPAAAMGVALFRQLIRAEEARQQFYAEGRVPEFLEPPSAHDQLYIQALIALKAGDPAGAAAIVEEAEAARTLLPGTLDGKAFADFRDLDDISANHLDVLTSTGKFYWIPLRKVETLTPHAPERRRDLLWRRVTIAIDGGPDGDVYLPTVYPFATPPSGAFRLGHETNFTGGEGTPVRGEGLRTFLIDDDAVSVLELGAVDFRA